MSERLRLIVQRHAKASAASGGASDHERVLASRGRDDAPTVAQQLGERGWVPDEVFCSDALRTTETFACLDGVLRLEHPPHLDGRLYLASPRMLVEVLRQAQEPTVMVVGHNPGLEGLVELLSGARVTMKTSHAVLLSRPVQPWTRALAPDSWRLDAHLGPIRA